MVTHYGNRVEEELRRLAAAGRPGDRMPSVRELAARHAAGPVTVQRVLSRLQLEGLLESRPGQGTFVARRAAAPVADVSWQTSALGPPPTGGTLLSDHLADLPAGGIRLDVGYPGDDLQPLGLLARAAAQAARRPQTWARPPADGVRELRAWFAVEAGAGVAPDDVLITPGGQAALSAAFRALARPGGAVVVESPTYLGALDAARHAGLRVIPVPTDADGVRPDLLASALESSRATVAYLQPRFANPTGVSLSRDRRADVLAAVRACGSFLVEDDYAHGLWFGQQAAPLLLADDPDGHVVHIRSLTKSVAPGLRVAGLVARGPALRRLRTSRLVEDLFVPGVLQETALGVVTAAGWPAHLTRLRRALAERLELAAARLAALEVVVPYPSRGGFLLWVRLPEGADDVAVAASAAARGVIVSPGSACFPAEPTGAYLRLSVAATGPDRIVEGIDRLGQVLRAVG